jgi:hypothetical protein
MRGPYEVLRLPRSATADDIKQSFRRLAKALHPDGNKNDPQAPACFVELSSAHEILRDEDKRRAFDRGEIDAEGKPTPIANATRHRRFTSNLGHIVTCLAIAVLVPIATLPTTPCVRILGLAGRRQLPTPANSHAKALRYLMAPRLGSLLRIHRITIASL